MQELKEELKELKEVKLPEAIKRVTAAREYGDLSENAEYHDARDEQEFIHTRIDDIEEIIANAKVVKGTRSQTVIGIGSTVTVKKNDSKTKQEFQIVGEYEADPMENKFQRVSLGKALIGKRQGDEVSVKAPPAPPLIPSLRLRTGDPLGLLPQIFINSTPAKLPQEVS